tara:strand:- start:3881 stop:5107 length:1227 start_codon:yes stop_codon:yes gene_type:complete
MLTFLSKSFFVVTIFSVIRLLIGAFVAGFFLPTDYAVIIVPMVLFTFLDLYIEGGYISAIVKLGIEEEERKNVVQEQFKKFLTFSPFLVVFLVLFSFYHADKLMPILVILNYCLISFIRIFCYTREGLLVATGKYIQVEAISFIMTGITYLFIFYLIFNSSIAGYYLLCLWHSIFAFLYALTIYFYAQDKYFDKYEKFQEIKKFAETNRNVSIVLTINNRIDELAAFNVLGSSPLGLFAKFKEIALAFGTLTSKIINKPWFYVACNSPFKYTMKLYLYAYFMFFIVFLILFPLGSWVINSVIGIMGENWTQLFIYSDYVLIFLFCYFLCEFSRNTLLACGGEDFTYKLEKTFLILRVLAYSTLLISSYFGFFKIHIFLFIIIELFLRTLFLLIENIGLYFIFKSRENF